MTRGRGRGGRGGGGGGFGAQNRGYSPEKMERTLLGKGFPFDVDKDDVKDFFNPYD